MKRLIQISIAFLFLITACDIIEEPFIEQNHNNNDTEEVVQKVLLEEFTGHQCPNCPAGAQVAKQLHDIFGSKFITIAYHAGFFARTSTSFPVDYRTSTGNDLNTNFGISSYPTGIINRKEHDGSLKLDKSLWPEVTSSLIENEPKLSLKLSKNYDNNSRNLSVTVNAKALSNLESLKLCVFITESNIISPQKTANDPNYPDGTIPQYNHKHVYRVSLNGTWGQELFAEGAIANQTQTIPVSGVLNSTWVAENMSIVCFAYSDVTGEIIQVEEAKVIE